MSERATRRHARTAGNKSKTTHGPTLRGNWPEWGRERRKTKTSRQRKAATGDRSQREREGGTPLPPPLNHTHTSPLQQPGPAGSTDGEKKCPQIAPRIG